MTRSKENNVTELPSDIMMDIQYLTERRDDELEHFNDGVKQYLTKKRLIERLDRVLRVNSQLKTMEGAVVVSALARNAKSNEMKGKRQVDMDLAHAIQQRDILISLIADLLKENKDQKRIEDVFQSIIVKNNEIDKLIKSQKK